MDYARLRNLLEPLVTALKDAGTQSTYEEQLRAGGSTVAP